MGTPAIAMAHLLVASIALVTTACAIEPISPPRPREKAGAEADEPLTSSFIPDPENERLRRSRALSRDLERLLIELEGVVSARVQLSLGQPHLFGATPRAPSRAAVVLRLRPGAEVSHTDVKVLLSGGVTGLAGEHISIVEREETAPPAKPPSLVEIGPLQVTAETAWVARLLLGGLLVICACLASALVYTSWRLRIHNRPRG